MALLLEFFIGIFGIPWLIWKTLGAKNRVLAGRRAQEAYQERSRAYSSAYEASSEEFALAKDIISRRVAYNTKGLSGPNVAILRRMREYLGLYADSFVSLIKDDIEYVFGQDSKIITDGEYTPRNNKYFVRKIGTPYYHGEDLMLMLILAKMGKIPPYLTYGSTSSKFDTIDNVECRFLRRIEQTLRQHGVPADFVMVTRAGDTRYFRHRQCTPQDRGEKAW